MAWIWPGIRRAPSVARALVTIDESLDKLQRLLSLAGFGGGSGSGSGGGSVVRGAGTAVVDFGAFPGSAHATVAVAGQGAIAAASQVQVQLRPVDSVDHSADEHMLEQIEVFGRDIVAGTGFTIHGVSTGAGLLYGKWNVAWLWL